ncbi:DUF883 family protein [Paraburkholderia sp. 22098]|uniref:DUF883 family protein n=1 Tax=Paraburkholderia sp. 22098 TaxID=3453874 RepID=UPI003F8796EE
MTESLQPTAPAAVPQPVASDRSGASESSRQRNDGQTSARTLSDLKDKIACAQEVVRTKYRVVSESTDDYVHEAPWKAVTMALIGGLIIGMLARR